MLRSIWSLNISDKKILNLPAVKNADKMYHGYDASDFTFGYYENGLFYEDEQKTKPIHGVETELYLDISNSYVYGYNGTMSRYEFVSELVIKFIKVEDSNIGDITDIKNMIYPKLTIMGLPGYEVTLTCGQRIISSVVRENGVAVVQLPCLGIWKVCITRYKELSTSVDVREIGGMHSVVLKCPTCEPCSKGTNIYGVIWDGSSTTRLTRTDDAAVFSDPVPALSGAGGSSPFDDCYPWSDIERVTIGGNSLVKIPKFWYKITKDGNSLKFQIADGPVDGFNVSPAHADRGDGKGERDYVYIGRYKCDSSYKSVAGASPKVNITREEARNGITSLGPGYYMQDFALWWTVRMLYLVEFADWNSQAVIGYNCGNNRGRENTGTTDSMAYHTGTVKSSRTTYGTGVQYRWIEDPWGNVFEWCDGIRFSGSSVYVFKNPSEYSDASGGVNTGTRPTSDGRISQWSVPTVEGYDWALYPSAVKGSNSTYIPDNCSYSSSGVVLFVGGDYVQGQYYGAFFLYGSYTASSSNGNIGVRLQYLP